MQAMVNIAVQAVRNASKIVARAYDELDRIQISEKGRNDFVTNVDRASEQEIIKVIHKAYPSHSILAEESGHSAGDDYCWVIDPLDGTMNFIHGFPHFSISVALKYKERYEVGVVYDPIRQDLFTALRGRGARLNDRRIRVSQCQRLEQALLGTGFPFRLKDHLKTYLNSFETIFNSVSGIRRAGSAALDLAYVAAGKLDGFWEFGLGEWDHAAGALLVQEAGGFVSDFYGNEKYNKQGNILAATTKLHPMLVELLTQSFSHG